jgi:hypothetical protein
MSNRPQVLLTPPEFINPLKALKAALNRGVNVRPSDGSPEGQTLASIVALADGGNIWAIWILGCLMLSHLIATAEPLDPEPTDTRNSSIYGL